ncbi:MAG TPA: helix-hairpin-helix domain-containing protein [Edaphocola sp.]|nr:helix-hairpin-helix domain-containing protein [Edaphocola sp.]
MTNREIAKHFELLSKLMDIHNEDSFRAKSYATSAFRIEKQEQELANLDLETLKLQPNISASLAEKIFELTQSGSLQILEDYLQKTPKGVVDMLSIKGIGPKKISLLWQELGIESIGELEYACQENRLVTLKGFGAKTQAAILESIKFMKANSGFCLYSEADALVSLLDKAFEVLYPKALYSPTGAFMQQQDVMNRIEWVCTLTPQDILLAFKEIEIIEQTLEANTLIIQIAAFPPLVFHILETEQEYWLTLFKTAASEAFISLFEKDFEYPETIVSEEQIFEKKQINFIPPYLRWNEESIQQSKANKLPDVIQPKDIKGIIHSHSTYSDGLDSLRAMALAAQVKGYEYLVISDHSKAAFYANGLSEERIKQQHHEIDILNKELAPFKIFKSIESDILYDGSLDYEDEVLSSFDLVIASVHSNLKMNEDKAMQRLLTAIQHPCTRILGHPTGRLLLSREGYPIDHKMIIDACVTHQVVIEINAHPRRLDLDWTWIQYAIEKGALLSINPDAHSIDGIDLVQYGVLSAQKAGLEALHNLSSYTLMEMEQFVKDRGFRKGV